MKHKNQWVLFAVLLLALISLSPGEDSALTRSDRQEGASYAPQPKPRTEKEAGRIKVAASMAPDEFNRLNQINQAFMKEHRVQVELVNIPEKDAYHSFKSSMEMGEAPDVLLLDNAWIREFASSGFLLPVEAYNSGQAGADSLSTSLSQTTWNGYVWGVPKDYDPYVVVYHPARLQELGYTQLPKSSGEWSALIGSFNKNKHIPYLAALDPSDAYAAISLLWRMGADQDNGKNHDFRLTSDMRAAFLRIQEMKSKFYVSAGDEAGEERIWKRLERGEILFYVTKASAFGEKLRPGLKMEQPSQERGVPMLWLEGRSFCLSAQSRNAKTANAWISEITSSRQQAAAYREGGKLPTLKTLYNQPDLKGIGEWVSAIQDRGRVGIVPVDARLPAYLNKLSSDAAKYLAGTGSLKSFMASFEHIGHAARP
ncbi:extracellular solute-binding protein [Paenibacillus sp. YPG26]|uniref:extracellular solute-binding protein n=1 Tax=Paenibacillus sp. YPG26 TaxID=2878915 RepID=UPI00203F7226|nr:extracellular solute-binding protein [Paenibacillus sp. YPG26]USB34484.1 extracellular solute-binding protein [Paenibacillus sp. YPG26]